MTCFINLGAYLLKPGPYIYQLKGLNYTIKGGFNLVKGNKQLTGFFNRERALLADLEWLVSMSLAYDLESLSLWLKQELAGLDLGNLQVRTEELKLVCALAGTMGNQAGVNGSFSFTLSLSDPLKELSWTMDQGVILASEYQAELVIPAGSGGSKKYYAVWDKADVLIMFEDGLLINQETVKFNQPVQISG